VIDEELLREAHALGSPEYAVAQQPTLIKEAEERLKLSKTPEQIQQERVKKAGA
jgi:hypothetical protein